MLRRAFRPKTLQGRLALWYAAALSAALIAFALLALFVVDREQREALDVRLASTATMLLMVGDIRNGRLVLDQGDRRQFATIAGSGVGSAVAAGDGSILITNDAAHAATLVQFALQNGSRPLTSTNANGERFRVDAHATAWAGKTVGYTVTWGNLGVIAALDRKVALAFAVAIPFVVALAVVAGAIVARRGLAPLGRISAVASEIEAKDLSRRLALPNSGDELSTLGATFDRMLDRLQAAFDRERRFTSDASHELRAPLSVIRAEADLALRQERAPAEYRRALETIAAEADALEALTRDLLAAARSGSAAEEERGPVDLASIASAVAQRVSILSGSRQICVDAAARKTLVQANRILLERAVLSVVHNALKYTPEAGSVSICVSGTRPRAELTIRDEGPGFSTAALQRGCDRFWRADEARTLDGSGLGLYLAKTIVERYGGTIVLANAEPHGAVVRMTFPAI